MFEVQWKAEYLDGTSAWQVDETFACLYTAIAFAEEEARKHPEIQHRVRRKPVKGKTIWKSWSK